MSPQEKIDAIKGLLAHPGWRLLIEALEADVDAKLRQMCEAPHIPSDRLHYLRGAIYSTRAILDAPNLALRDLSLAALERAAKADEAPTE